MTEILCITHKYPPMIGGMEKQSFELINGLSRHYKTHVIAYQNEVNKVLWFANLKSKVKAILKKNQGIRLIHLNDASMGAACLWLQKFTEIPVVVTYHGLDITFPLEVYQNRIVPRLANYNGAICVSSYTRQQCLNRNFKEKTTFTVNNGVDISMGDIPVYADFANKLKAKYGVNVEGKHILLVAGRPVVRKGFSWFLKNVMPLLNDNILLLMIGSMKTGTSAWKKRFKNFPGSHHVNLFLGLENDTQEISEQLKKNKNAIHLGSVPYEDLLQILSLADLFLMPNIEVKGDEEGFGLVALEASIRGTYVLASGIEGITDAVIDGKNGKLLPSGNAQAWADKIHELLSDKMKLQQLAAKGKEFTQNHYSWDIMVKGYKKIFDMIIQ